MPPLRVLHLEDDPFFADMVEALLKTEWPHAAVRRAGNFKDFEDALRAYPADLILSDHEVPGGDGLKALALCRRERPIVPFVFVSGRLGEEIAIDSLKNGAADYVLKTNMSRFIPTVVRTLAACRETAALRAAEERIRRDRANLHGLIENTLDAIWSMDLECNVLAFNSAASLLCMKMTGHPMVEGTCFLDRLSPAAQARWREAVARVRAQERFQEEHELEWLGKRYALEIGFNPVLSGRAVAGMAVFAKDVTARKRVEAAEASLDLQSQRLAAAYRRMRVPLHSLERLSGALGRLAGGGPLQRPIAMLAASVRRLAELHARAEPAGDGLRRQFAAGTRAEPGDGPGSARGPAAQGGDARAHGIERRAEPPALRILVVEDNPVNQLVVAGVLNRLGREFDLAADGRQAVDACARAGYDLVLMDCQMPEMDGLQATRAIRAGEAASGRRAFIAALTANNAPGLKEACLEAGMDAFLEKPLRPAALEALLAEAARARDAHPARP